MPFPTKISRYATASELTGSENLPLPLSFFDPSKKMRAMWLGLANYQLSKLHHSRLQYSTFGVFESTTAELIFFRLSVYLLRLISCKYFQF